ncbi:MAG: hypothetical protein ACK4F5_16320 [Aliihoeflea sp.]
MGESTNPGDWSSRHIRLRVQLLITSGVFLLTAAGGHVGLTDWLLDERLPRDIVSTFFLSLSIYYLFHYAVRSFTEMWRFDTLFRHAPLRIEEVRQQIDRLLELRKAWHPEHMLERLAAWKSLEALDLKTLLDQHHNQSEQELNQLKSARELYQRMVQAKDTDPAVVSHVLDDIFPNGTPLQTVIDELNRATKEARTEITRLDDYLRGDFGSGHQAVILQIDKITAELRDVTREWTRLKNTMTLERILLSGVLPGLVGFGLICWGALVWFGYLPALPVATASPSLQ